MGFGRITRIIPVLLALAGARLGAEEFQHFGYFLLESHFKLTGSTRKNIPIKPVVFRVSTDGITVRVSVDGEEDSSSAFEIYRSDGIGRQRGDRGALEVIPGIQAMSKASGELRHLRLCREFLTITTFPGVSDQTVISHAVAAEPKPNAKPTNLPNGKAPPTVSPTTN